MAWSNIEKAPVLKGDKISTPDGLWQKCHACQEIFYRKDFEANQFVCVKCQFHFPIPAYERLARFLDGDSFVEQNIHLRSPDPLKFVGKKAYSQQLKESIKKTQMQDAFVCGEGLLKGQPVQVGSFEFGFMGGSMGCVVGEKISRLLLQARDKKHPAIIFSASGGARMQEGLLSLMQMAKTCAALSQLRSAELPLISVLTNPTTGGVAASYAMLGDINIGEPGALIGFAGPRVIQQTIGQSLPEGFQTSEYLLEHGMLDLICHRTQLRDQIAHLLSILMSRK
ncbi:MAG: acetyl-CoA carboxylase carboxyltransferase subunit beta [Oligoflexales bacterium]|nr:acetyl-CoA carboxylase carboxyltransferase subunit beta [Oligoflexales bacterium]